MEHKIFLGKYRVAADEMALSGPEPVGQTAGAEQHQTAIVYRGDEIESGRDVAIEVIPAASYKTVVREELEAEALAARKIIHINIPAIYDFGVEDDHLIYVTEYFDGTSAEEWVNQHGPMPTGAVLRIALQVVSAMGACAFHKISHHAINPGNLMLVPGQTPEGDWPLIKVLHFIGVAPTFTSAEAPVSTTVASFDKTSHYASPEQLQHGTVDFRSEIYSLGATMWFLLTGAPPLIAPKGPLAMQPTTHGLAVDKLNGMPKKVRRLLAQMLSVNPQERPDDPLAFYRQIQDCLAQVDRRESMARKFGVPLLAGSSAALPSRRRFPAKALALAALLLALATLGAIVIPNYLRQERVRQAEEPIGVPIGVPEATESAPPLNPNAVVAQVPAETSVASTNPVQNPPPTNTEEVAPAPPSTAPASPPVVAANEAATAPVQPAPPAPPANVQPEESPKVVASEVASAPVKPLPTAEPAEVQREEPPKVAANDVASAPAPVKPLPTAEPVEVQREESPRVAANETVPEQREVTEPKATESIPAEKREVRSNRKTEVAAIPTARPVAPEVRRAEPAPPAEAPEEVVAENTEEAVAPVPVPASRTKKERVAKTKRQPKRDEARPEFVITDEAEEPGEPAQKLPKGRVRARFIGVTADGNWMLSLPKDKIVIVPPPPGG
ncbi:MAG TPA: protein kinase [Chthoniobacterales bacterium]|nr:protein kinase [Chthoniobacterales bacterium]